MGRSVQVLVDAEMSHLNPALTCLTCGLMWRHNRAGSRAWVWNTWQAYLRVSTPGTHLGTPGDTWGHTWDTWGHLGTPGHTWAHLGGAGTHLGGAGTHLGTPGHT